MKIVSRTEYPWKGWHIALIDALVVWLSFGISYLLRYEVQFLRPVDEINSAPFRPYIPYTLIFMAWVLTMHQAAGLYQDMRGRSLVSEIFKITNATSNAVLLIMALSFLIRPLVFSRLLIIQAAFINVFLQLVWRMALRSLRNTLHRRGIGVEQVLVVGCREAGRYVIRTIVARPDLGYKLVGFVDDDPELGGKDLGRVPALGAIKNIPKIVKKEHVDLVILTLPWDEQRHAMEVMQNHALKKISVLTVPDLYQLNLSQVQVEMLGGLPLLGRQKEGEISRRNLVLKRALDIIVTALLLPFALPIMGLAALAIRLDTPGPILFYQRRVGLNGQLFEMVKFRSMVEGAEQQHDEVIGLNEDDPEGYKRKYKDADPRITRVGRFIRRTSIDELPQLFNVLRGEMSLVGPRPALPKEVELYKPWHRQRLMVRPGLTGLWQVSGRSEIPFEEKCLLDIYYIENWSIGLDLQILIQTAPQILFGTGAY